MRPDHPRDKEPKHAVAPDIEAEVQDDVCVDIRRQCIRGVLKCFLRGVSASSKHLPQSRGTGGKVLVNTFITHPEMQDSPESEQNRSDFR